MVEENLNFILDLSDIQIIFMCHSAKKRYVNSRRKVACHEDDENTK